MTTQELKADNLLLDAKTDAKRSLTILDPAPKDPLAQAILRVLDAIDYARRKLKERTDEREPNAS